MSPDIDRRKFLKYGSAAGAATGALWVAPSVLGSSSAFAAGSCQIRDQIDWGFYNPGDLAWSSGTYSVNLPVNRVTGNGTPTYDVKMEVKPVGNVLSRFAEVTGSYMGFPASYKLGMQGNNPQVGNYGWDVTFTWQELAVPHNPVDAYNLNVTVGEIDQDGGNTTDNAYLTPVLNVPPDSGGLSPTFVHGIGTQTNPWHGVNGNQSDTGVVGNVSVAYSVTSPPLTTWTVHYRGDVSQTGSVQSIGIANLSWCL